MKKFTYLCLLFSSLMVGALQAQVVINEYSCSNWAQFANSFQEYDDWIELYNTSLTDTVNLAGYTMSDNEDKPQKWEIPVSSVAKISPGGFLRIWCSGRGVIASNQLHTNFKLTQTKSNAEHLILASPAGVILQDIKIKKSRNHQSLARATDGSAVWKICTAPSPGATNNGTLMYAGFADRPDMNQTAGFYQDSVTVAITTTETNAVIRYTLNGDEPVATSTQYSTPIKISSTTVLKATTFSSDPQVLPSFVEYNTFFINVDHSLVVISVGSDGVLELANGNQGLRPQGSCEYFGKDKTRKSEAYGELNSHGQDSWVNDQRSLDWVSRDEFGYNGSIEEKIFERSSRDEYQRFILRAAGDDNFPDASGTSGSAHIRDAYIHNLADRGGLHLDVRRSEKAILYLNGQYWGVYDLRELPDDHDYTDYYYGQGKFDIQYILTWGNTWAEYGGNTALANYQSLYNFIQNNSMADPAKYAYVDERYDVKSLADYVIANGFTVCSDWLNYNTGWWRGLNPEGGHQKWGYILWDNDATFGHYINYTGIPDTSPYALPCDPETLTGGSDPKGHIKVLKKLRQNPDFNQYYITRQADLMNTVFGCENMLNYLDTIVSIIQPEMMQHCERWDGSYDQWLAHVNKMRNFITIRCGELPDGLKECYTLNGPYGTVIKVDPPEAGTLQVNSLDFPSGYVAGNYFGGIGTKMTATTKLPQQYVFDYWSASNHTFIDSTAATALLNLTVADTIIAHFRSGNVPTNEVETAKKPSVLAYPTVFEDQFTVEYNLPVAANVKVTLVNLLGETVSVILENTPQGSGTHVLNFDNEGLPSGVYMLSLKAGLETQTIKVICAK